MDINSYSYAPYMLDDVSPIFRACDSVTIEKKTGNGNDYYIITDMATGGYNKAYSLRSALAMAKDWMAKDWIENGV